MSVTPMLNSDTLSVELWSARLKFVEMMKRFQFGRLAATGVMKRVEELDRAQAGDEITITQIGRLTGIGTGEGGTLEGNEESQNLNGELMKFGVFRHAVAFPGPDTVEDARSHVRFEEEAEVQLRQFHGSRVDASCFNQLAGSSATTITIEGATYSGTNRTFVQGLNTITAPTTNRIVRAAAAATDQALTSSDTMNLDLIDVALEKLQTTAPTAESLDNDEWDIYISHEQGLDLRRDSSGSIQWYTNELARVEGGQASGNPIFDKDAFGKRPIGKYANVNIYESNNVAFGQNSSTSAKISTVRRAVLCGKSALLFSSKFSGALMGEDTGGNAPLKFITDRTRDYGYVVGKEGRMLYGVKKHVFNPQSEDYGVVVISTFATTHTS